MTQVDQTEQPTPWYKQFWPWFLIAIPGVTIGYCIFFITMSLSGKDSLVTDSFYKDGLVYTERRALEKRAANLGIVANVDFAKTGGVTVDLESNEPLPLSQLQLELIHPTLETEDRKLVLHRVADGSYRSSLDQALAGRWRLYIKPMEGQWRLDADLNLPANQPVRVAPPSDS